MKRNYILIGILAAAAICIAAFAFLKNHNDNVPPVTVATAKTDRRRPKITKTDLLPIRVPADVVLRGKSVKLPILMYHHIGEVPNENIPDPVRVGLTVAPENFEKQISILKNQGFVSVSLDDLYQFTLGKKQLPKKPVIFTFDDGYDDVFTNAVPVLKKYGFTGTFAVITNDPGQTQGTNTYATWQTIAAAKDDGMEIVCHTQNHFDGSNPKFSADYILQNLTGCQKTLAEKLGSAEPYLIYPYGHYTAQYIEQAKKAGFVMALTVHEGNTVNLENLMEIPRIRVTHGADFAKIEKLMTE